MTGRQREEETIIVLGPFQQCLVPPRLGLKPKEERKAIGYTDKSGELSPAYVCTLLV